MPEGTLLFWHGGPHLRLSPSEVAREILWGEEVEGLIDLPVKVIIEALKSQYPAHREQAGQLVLQVESGRFEITWTWQSVRADSHNVPQDERQRLINAIEAFGCTSYEADPAT
jgi:hypothetical protein